MTVCSSLIAGCWITQAEACYSSIEYRASEMVFPQRTCIGCRQVRAKRDLIRIVISAPPSVGNSDLGSPSARKSDSEKTRLSKPRGGVITIDLHGKRKGRGAYVCPNVDCIKKAMQPERLNRAFRISDHRVQGISDRRVRENRVTHGLGSIEYEDSDLGSPSARNSDLGSPSARKSDSEKTRSADHISLETISKLKQDLLELIDT